MMEKSISDFHTSFYIPEIQKLVVHLPRVRILGTNNCFDTRCEAFKCRRAYKDLFCGRGYADIMVASFEHEIQSE